MTTKPVKAAAALILMAGFLVLFIGGGARFAISLTLKPIVEEFGWGRSDIGLAVAIFQIVSAVTMLASGYLVDRTGPRLVLGGGLFIAGIGIGLMSAITEPWHALVLYGVIFALGNGAASVIPVGVMVTRAFPGRTGIANAAVVSGMSLGQLVVIAVLSAMLVTMSWHSVYFWLGVVHLALVPVLFLAIPKGNSIEAIGERTVDGVSVIKAARSRQFWLLMAVYAICGFDDFFVATHIVAFAQDRGVDAFLAGNLLALMGLTGLVGVIAAGMLSDHFGPIWPTALSFVARIAVFALVMADQSATSVTIFALVFGVTFLVTAPLTVVFVLESFGTRHLGTLSGLITMVHHIFGGIGAYLGAATFDATGGYSNIFLIMLVASALALLLTLLLRQR